MRVLVTGGTGMVGSCIKDLVHQYPQHEFVFTSRSSNNLSNKVELTNKTNVESFFSFFHDKFDYIIHLAADVGGLFKNLDENAEMFSNNIAINENVLSMCKKYNMESFIIIFCDMES